jgi:hypothetical protein
MATRSMIAVLNDNFTYSVSYCHWDGYPSHVGKILYAHYKTEESIRKLIDGGDISSIELDGTPNYYSDTKPLVCSGYMDLLSTVSNNGAEYLYVFTPRDELSREPLNVWECVFLNRPMNRRHPLVECLGK